MRSAKGVSAAMSVCGTVLAFTPLLPFGVGLIAGGAGVGVATATGDAIGQHVQKKDLTNGLDRLNECEQRVLWEIADLIVYNKAPHAYDALPHHRWDFEAVTSVAALAGTVVLDVGAGTGQTAVELSRRARSVFAIEPVGRLRQFIRERAERRKRGNLYVVDGMAHAIPLPSQFADVVVCVRSLRKRGVMHEAGGWRFDDEVAELERVVRPGGTVVVCSGWPHEGAEDRPEHHTLVSPRWGYRHDAYAGYAGQLSRYHKQF